MTKKIKSVTPVHTRRCWNGTFVSGTVISGMRGVKGLTKSRNRTMRIVLVTLNQQPLLCLLHLRNKRSFSSAFLDHSESALVIVYVRIEHATYVHSSWIFSKDTCFVILLSSSNWEECVNDGLRGQRESRNRWRRWMHRNQRDIECDERHNGWWFKIELTQVFWRKLDSTCLQLCLHPAKVYTYGISPEIWRARICACLAFTYPKRQSFLSRNLRQDFLRFDQHSGTMECYAYFS